MYHPHREPGYRGGYNGRSHHIIKWGGHAPWLVVISGVGDELSLYKELCGLPQQDHHSEVEKLSL
ncbi:hypothetical protein MU476_15735, partial [Staphylococcus aureus]